jgi:hypothetical protein
LLHPALFLRATTMRSVQMLRWPDAMAIHVCERGPLRDTPLAVVYLGVPGLAGAPHVDPRPLPYQFVSSVPARARGAPGACSPGAGPGSPR